MCTVEAQGGVFVWRKVLENASAENMQRRVFCFNTSKEMIMCF